MLLTHTFYLSTTENNTRCLHDNAKESYFDNNNNEVLKTEISEQRYENAHLKTKISRLEDQITRIESQSRRDSLLINGLDESENENCTEKVRKCLNKTSNLMMLTTYKL